jgi:choice-of-anchor B domain-containing protein
LQPACLFILSKTHTFIRPLPQNVYFRSINFKPDYMRLFLLVFATCWSTFMGAQNTNLTFRSKITYPGQTLANIFGYTANGKEYALIGGRQGMIIVDVTNPDVPVQITQIPGPVNLWKEIKTYQHYAYVVTEGGQGIQVVDLSNLPSSDLLYHNYRGDGAILNQLNKIHALHIDVAKGYLYAYGGDLFSGGVKVFNLNPDPYNPVYVGKFDQLGYVHDGYVDNDTMYAGHIYAGYFSVVNMADKSNPELINTQPTPNAFTHNTWLTDDRKHILSTDERNNSFLACYDVSDPEDIKFLDQIQSNPGSNSMVHNTHIVNNFAVTSWYKDGITIVDVSRPHNLIQTGNYDTYAGAGGGSEGCWGVYPFFPSGTVVASNITSQGTGDGEFYVFTPNYVRGCYLEGQVRNAVNGNPIAGATITATGTAISETSSALGNFAGGQLNQGSFPVTVSKTGFQSFNTQVQLQQGVLRYLDVELFPEGNLTIGGVVLDGADQSPVANAPVWIYGNQEIYNTTTNGSGAFSVSNVKPGYYDITASDPTRGMAILYQEKILADGNYTLELYQDHKRDEASVDIWPNPFERHCTLSLKQENPSLQACHIQVMNNLGQLIQDIPEYQSNTPLILGANWAPGIYFVHIRQAGKPATNYRLLKSGQ